MPSAISMPNENVSSSDEAGPNPMSMKRSWMSGAMSTQGLPSLAPSNITVPIITNSSAIVPGSGSSDVTPDSGLRQPSRPALTASGDSRENRLKYTENASPRESQVSVPKQAMPSRVIAL